MHPRIVLEGLQDLEHTNRVIGGESLLVSVKHLKKRGLAGKCNYPPVPKSSMGSGACKTLFSKCDLLCNNRTSVCFGWSSLLKKQVVIFIFDMILDINYKVISV